MRLAIVGGGPTALYLFKRLLEGSETELSVDIFERSDHLGCGMPYGQQGAADEHITNVSGNEIPELMTDVADWVKSVPKDTLDKYNIDAGRFNDYKVLPRLLFGQYLCDQFGLLQKRAKEAGLEVNVYYRTRVDNIKDLPKLQQVQIILSDEQQITFDKAIICTGHLWPKQFEDDVPGWFDSPYPPEKIAIKLNHTVAIRGASLTAVDAIRTLARHNGEFTKDEDGKLSYEIHPGSENFRIVLHTRNGLLPAVRFHLEDSHLGKDTVLQPEIIRQQRQLNAGFLPLDFVFEENFKKGIREHDPGCYEEIKGLSMEEFVERVMQAREDYDPFELLKTEYREAERSIEKRKSIYWKEQLAILSFAMNYPAKYFSAEDRLRLEKTLMPLISLVIAFIPQSSAETLMALHDAGRLSMKVVAEDDEPKPGTEGGADYADVHYPLFIDCVGQPHLAFDEIPFPGLRENQTISPARLRFRDADAGQELLDEGNERVSLDRDNNYYLKVPGLAINDQFQPLDLYDALNDRIYIMAVPFIGGYNPDYSGLDFSEAASKIVVDALLTQRPA